MGDREDYPPLLAPGWHPMTMPQLCAVCVEPFPLSKRRKLLWEKFEHLVARLRELRIPCVLWVDGSMLRQKLDPRDIEVVLEISGPLFEALPTEPRAFVDSLINKQVCDPDTDVLFLAMWPEGHPLHDASDWLRSLYVVYCGWNKARDEEHGIPRIDLRETA